MQIPEALQILGLEIPFNPDDVKRAFRRKVLEHHPDRFPDLEEKIKAHVKFLEIRGAYEQLKTTIAIGSECRESTVPTVASKSEISPTELEDIKELVKTDFTGAVFLFCDSTRQKCENLIDEPLFEWVVAVLCFPALMGFFWMDMTRKSIARCLSEGTSNNQGILVIWAKPIGCILSLGLFKALSESFGTGMISQGFLESFSKYMFLAGVFLPGSATLVLESLAAYRTTFFRKRIFLKVVEDLRTDKSKEAVPLANKGTRYARPMRTGDSE